jgi:ABC-type Fe3+/spermidine/putrescine transport system ATPase subunit
VMDAGRIAQVGSPKEVYDRPNSPFVASFMGAENTLDLDVRPSGAGVEVRVDDSTATALGADVPVGHVTAYFRDDIASLVDPQARIDGSIVLPGKITQRTYPGGHYRYVVAIGDRHFTVTDDRYHELDRPVGLRLPLASLHLFPKTQTTGGHHA